jgi:holo-[acyl-carrier protein] synthase
MSAFPINSEEANSVGVGVDIESISRFEESNIHSERFFEGIFTDGEIQYCRKKSPHEPHFAARYAAKEAILKALCSMGYEVIGYKKISIVNDGRGVPRVSVDALFDSELEYNLSLSHCDKYAVASVIIHRV